MTPAAYDGPVKIGLATRHTFTPSTPVAVAQLERGALTAGAPVTVMLSKPLDEVVKGGKLVAALYPVLPDDPVDASEQGVWYHRYDRYLFQAQPTAMVRDGDGWSLTPGKSTIRVVVLWTAVMAKQWQRYCPGSNLRSMPRGAHDVNR